jgi:hypothetical protein
MNITEKALSNWVDIEEEYYTELLKKIEEERKSNPKFDKIEETIIGKLHYEFKKIQDELEIYLSKATKEDTNKNKSIYNHIYSAQPIRYNTPRLAAAVVSSIL